MTFQLPHPLPIVHDNLVAMFPGTSVLIVGDVVDGRIVNMRVVDDAEMPSNAMRIRMWQEVGKPDTFVAVTNYFPVYVKYRAAMMLPEADDIRPTSSCPVMSNGKLGYEHWPYPVFQILLDDFHVVPETDTLTCN